MVVQEKKYMKLNVSKVVDNMTQGSCIPTDSVKSRDDYSNFIHKLEIGAYVNSDKTNPTYFVS